MSENKIAFVMASSTMDLYDHSFYPFSIIHADIKKAEFVMSHKELLFPNVPTREKKSFDNHKAMGLHQNREYTSSLLSNTNLHYLIDEDVHNGIIFNQDNNNNLYDILIQGHYQYVTLNRCYIFKKFVENGEIIISLNANTFYAEVNYDILNNQITFVKCHLLNAIIGLLMEKRQWRLVKEKKKDGMMQLLNVPELILAVIFVQLLLIIIPFHIHI